ncbi:MAG: riboflavin biosynthesis protein RibD, partial [Candidatus Micrarchaeota archaeon]|nr:riboflavin biosynthesis protein RibD [Candidatus Micrarchaeota archaeon]
MRMAMDLAQKNRHIVLPNPCVGCVIVSNGRVVGTGWH